MARESSRSLQTLTCNSHLSCGHAGHVFSIQPGWFVDARTRHPDRPKAPGAGGVDEDLESEAEGAALVEWLDGEVGFSS